MASFKRIIPLFDRVLVRRVAAETRTASGIFLPESAQSKLNQGVVVAVGHGKKDYSPVVNVGDRVLLPEYGGSHIKMNGDNEKEEYALFREEDLLAVLKDQ